MSDTIEPTDDVEAHAMRGKAYADESADDVEGHGRTRLTDPRPEGPADDAPLSDDDVTGHAARAKF